MTDKIKFFIGSDRNGGCSECQMVIEYSIKKNCSVPYEIEWMTISEYPESYWHGWNTSTWSTPFSGFRYGIAERNGFEGRQIYTDDDMIWLKDPAEYFKIEIPKNQIMTGKRLPNGETRHCVSLIDSKKWKDLPSPNKLHNGKKLKEYAEFTEHMKQVTFPLTHFVDGNWNNYDGENEAIENIGLLHFTDMSTNPGVKLAIKRLGSQAEHWYNGIVREHRRKDIEDVFYQYYEEALAAGFRVADYVPNSKLDYKKQDQSEYRANNGYDVTQGQ